VFSIQAAQRSITKLKKQLLMERRSAAFVWLGHDETPRRCLRAAIRNPKK